MVTRGWGWSLGFLTAIVTCEQNPALDRNHGEQGKYVGLPSRCHRHLADPHAIHDILESLEAKRRRNRNAGEWIRGDNNGFDMVTGG